MSKEGSKTVTPEMAAVLFGFCDGWYPSPCYFCGEVTTLADAEDFSKCRKCQLEEIEIGYDAMKKRFPLYGKDERNPEFYKKEKEEDIKRFSSMTKEELERVKLYGTWPAEMVEKTEQGGILSEDEQAYLGSYARHWDYERSLTQNVTH